MRLIIVLLCSVILISCKQSTQVLSDYYSDEYHQIFFCEEKKIFHYSDFSQPYRPLYSIGSFKEIEGQVILYGGGELTKVNIDLMKDEELVEKQNGDSVFFSEKGLTSYYLDRYKVNLLSGNEREDITELVNHKKLIKLEREIKYRMEFVFKHDTIINRRKELNDVLLSKN